MKVKKDASLWERLSVMFGGCFMPDTLCGIKLGTNMDAGKGQVNIMQSTSKAPKRDVEAGKRELPTLPTPPPPARCHNVAPTEHVPCTHTRASSAPLCRTATPRDIGDGSHSSQAPLSRRTPQRHNALTSIAEAQGAAGDDSCRGWELAIQGPTRAEDRHVHMQGTRCRPGRSGGGYIRSSSADGRTHELGSPQVAVADPFERVRRQRQRYRLERSPPVSCPGNGGGASNGDGDDSSSGAACPGNGVAGTTYGNDGGPDGSAGRDADPLVAIELAGGRLGSRGLPECCFPITWEPTNPERYQPASAAAADVPVKAAGNGSGSAGGFAFARRFMPGFASFRRAHMSLQSNAAYVPEEDEQVSASPEHVRASGGTLSLKKQQPKSQIFAMAEDGVLQSNPASALVMDESPFTTSSQVPVPTPYSGRQGSAAGELLRMSAPGTAPMWLTNALQQTSHDFTDDERSSAPTGVYTMIRRSSSCSASSVSRSSPILNGGGPFGGHNSSTVPTQSSATRLKASSSSRSLLAPTPRPCPEARLKAASTKSLFTSKPMAPLSGQEAGMLAPLGSSIAPSPPPSPYRQTTFHASELDQSFEALAHVRTSGGNPSFKRMQPKSQIFPVAEGDEGTSPRSTPTHEAAASVIQAEGESPFTTRGVVTPLTPLTAQHGRSAGVRLRRSAPGTATLWPPGPAQSAPQSPFCPPQGGGNPSPLRGQAGALGSSYQSPSYTARGAALWQGGSPHGSAAPMPPRAALLKASSSRSLMTPQHTPPSTTRLKASASSRSLLSLQPTPSPSTRLKASSSYSSLLSIGATPPHGGKERPALARQVSSGVSSPSPSPYLRAMSGHRIPVPLMSTVMLTARRFAAAASGRAAGGGRGGGGAVPVTVEPQGAQGELAVRVDSVLAAPPGDGAATHRSDW